MFHFLSVSFHFPCSLSFHFPFSVSFHFLFIFLWAPFISSHRPFILFSFHSPFIFLSFYFHFVSFPLHIFSFLKRLPESMVRDNAPPPTAVQFKSILSPRDAMGKHGQMEFSPMLPHCVSWNQNGFEPTKGKGRKGKGSEGKGWKRRGRHPSEMLM